MSDIPDKSALRAIPPVDEVLAAEPVRGLRARHPHFPWTDFIRSVIADFRSGRCGTLRGGRERAMKAVIGRVVAGVEALRSAGMRRVINGTGVILHTNLGRAILGETVQSAVSEAMGHYVNLEFDLAEGKRGPRAEVLLDLLRWATGGEAAMVVNNNAAAVYLVVNACSPPGRVVISRSELVEIGGSFRLPDILRHAAAEVVEVGTTNRTYADDYAAVARPGDILMRAHRSNYDIQGFTHDATLDELVALAREKDAHVVYDLGSGSLVDFERAPLSGEPSVRDIVRTGVDCVTMSGDKLLGGVQAGIIVGGRTFLDRVGASPLRRALRVDKITIAALQALVRHYLFDIDPAASVPVIGQSVQGIDVLTARAERLAATVGRVAAADYRVSVGEDAATIGGGSLAGRDLESVALVIGCASEREATALAGAMRRRVVPVLSRIKGKTVRINLRSVPEHEDGELSAALCGLLRGEPSGRRTGGV